MSWQKLFSWTQLPPAFGSSTFNHFFSHLSYFIKKNIFIKDLWGLLLEVGCARSIDIPRSTATISNNSSTNLRKSFWPEFDQIMRWRCENTQVNVLNWANLLEHVETCWNMMKHDGTWWTNLTMLELLAPCSSHRGRQSTPLICTLLPFCLFPGWGWLNQNRISLLRERQNHSFRGI